MEAIQQQLAHHILLGIDTSIFIYHFESHPLYQPLSRLILNSIQSGQHRAVASVITVMELTVHPWRQGRADVARQYEMLLAHFPNLDLIDVQRPIAQAAARLRAHYPLKPADALHIATALHLNATAFVTNDTRLQCVSDQIDIVLLNMFV